MGRLIGVSLSEPHTDMFLFCRVYIYIYASYVRLTIYFHLGAKWTRWSPFCAAVACDTNTCHEQLQTKEIVQNEADTPTSAEEIAPTNLPPRSRMSEDPKRSSLQVTPLYNAHKNATKKNTQQHNCF